MPDEAEQENGEERSELAPANHLRALETNALHASDVIYWLDATTALAAAEMSRVGHRLRVDFTSKPRDVNVFNSIGRTALWRTPDEPMIVGYADEAQRTRPAMASFTVAGSVHDNSKRYHPRQFSLDLGAGDGVAVELYPSLIGTPVPPAGAVQGHIQFAASGEPAAWALLELTATVSVGDSVSFRAQADANGDFILPLTRLPPLPEGVTEYSAILEITADPAAAADTAPDFDNFVAMEVESTDTADDFQTQLTLTVRPGDIARIDSVNKAHLAIQTA